MKTRMEAHGFDKWYFEDVKFEIEEGTPEDVVATRELSKIADALGISEDTDEWDDLADAWWQMVEA